MANTELGNRLVEMCCIFCGAKVGAGGMCANGVRHCHFCRKPESHAADPCIPNQDHHFVRGHEFQRVPVGEAHSTLPRGPA